MIHSGASTCYNQKRDTSSQNKYYVRRAEKEDLEFINYALIELLKELRGTEKIEQISGLEQTFKNIISDTKLGIILIGCSPDDQSIGYLSFSFHPALHCGGDFAVFEELWVNPDRRSSWIGILLIREAERYISERGISRIEVGLANYNYTNYKHLYEFYKRLGYEDIGPRLKKTIS